MRNVNKVILIGNIARDPNSKEVSDGQTITTFVLATHRYFTTKTGEQRSTTEFHNVASWGPLAQRCSKDLKKGKLVYIDGYLKTKAFELENGEKSFRTEVVAQNMIILSKKDGDTVPHMKEENKTVTSSKENKKEDDDPLALDDMFDPGASSEEKEEKREDV